MVAILTLFMGLSSCDEELTPATLVGEWRLNAVDFAGQADASAGGFSFTGQGTNMDVLITFTEDPNEVTVTGSYDVQIEYTVLGNTQTIKVDDAAFIGEGIWSLDGNSLTVTANGISQSLEVLSLTENSASFSIDLTESIGDVPASSITGTFQFSRN